MLAWLLAAAPSIAGSPALELPKLDPATVPPSATGHGPQNNGKDHPVVARLVLDRTTLSPGATARVGVHLTQEDGWHTYWKTPGDVGQPTEIAWTLPPGFATGEQKFPLPERFDQDGQVSYGYGGSVLHIAELTVPADAKGQVTLAADVNWLVCLTSCIPGSAHVELPVTVDAGGGPSVHAPLFDAWSARWATPIEQVGALKVTPSLSTSGVLPESTFQAAFVVSRTDGKPLTVDPSKTWPTFAPIASGYDWGLTSTKLTLRPDGSLLVLLGAETWAPDPLPTTDRVGGLFQLDLDGTWVRTEVTAPIPWVAKGTAVTANPDPIFAAAAAPSVAAPPAAGPPPELAVAVPMGAPVAPQAGLLANLLLAFVGGLILNVMPCVLPVLTLKIYGLVEEAEMTARDRRTAGFAYTGGVLASFWALAGAVVGLRSMLGLDVDWGFQFQYPPYVAALATIVFAFGLSLLGVFEIPVLGAETAGKHASREGTIGVFFSGVFATLLATPCSAPFLGSAIAYAFGAPSSTLFAIFTAVGLGLASPFLLVAMAPGTSRYLPQPGAWMDLFKQAMGFSLLATTIWLFDVLQAQVGPAGATGFLVFLLAVGAGSWIFGRFGGIAESGTRQLLAGGAALGLAALIGVWWLDFSMPEAEAATHGPIGELTYDEHVPWRPFSEQAVADLDGKPVFIDFTAAWCLTCKVNEKTILETQAVRDAMKAHGVVPLKADWTRRDEIITEWLRRNGRAGVPMYLVIPADRSKAPILLPEVITPSMVTEALETASG